MFEVKKTFKFESGHVLCHHDGKCSQPHGHSYVLTLHLSSETLIKSGPKTNMVIDFTDIKTIVQPMIDEYFDHRWINDTLKTDSPTVEFMSKWIYDFLKPKLPLICAVTLFETHSSSVTYRPR